MTYAEFFRDFAGYVPPHARSLQKVKVDIYKCQLLLLSSFSSTLEELDLVIYRGSDDDDLGDIPPVIEGVPSLKKLKILAGFQASCRIKSASLEEIGTRRSCGGCWVDECICPSLRMCRSSNRISQLIEAMTGHSSDVEMMPKNAGGCVTNFIIGTSPFAGMNVPASCVGSITSSL